MLGRFPFDRTGRPDHCSAIALPVSLKMKWAFSKSFWWGTISFVHTIQDLTDLAGEFWLKGNYHCEGKGLAGQSDKWKAPLVSNISKVL